MFHGFPGNTTNNDISQGLRRMGCMVVNPFHRGAWGSEGLYTFSGLLEDTIAVARWVYREDVAQRYKIDREQIYLVGISMGGFTTLHTLASLPWIKGAVAMAPGDLAWLADAQCPERRQMLKAMIQETHCLKIASPQALYDDAVSHATSLALSRIAPTLRERNLYLIGGTRDVVVPSREVHDPFWALLRQHRTTGIHKYEMLEADHDFSNCRMELSIKTG